METIVLLVKIIAVFAILLFLYLGLCEILLRIVRKEEFNYTKEEEDDEEDEN